MKAEEIVAKEVARQAEFGMEPSWDDFVIAGIEEGRREEQERMTKCLRQLHKKGWTLADVIQAEDYNESIIHLGEAKGMGVK